MKREALVSKIHSYGSASGQIERMVTVHSGCISQHSALLAEQILPIEFCRLVRYKLFNRRTSFICDIDHCSIQEIKHPDIPYG